MALMRMKAQFQILLMFGCLLVVVAAGCSEGCASCDGSTCSKCHDKYYWDTDKKDCVSVCTGTITLNCQPYGGLGVCYHNSESPCKEGNRSKVIVAIVISCIVAFFLILLGVAAYRSHKDIQHRHHLKKTCGIFQNYGHREFIVFGVHISYNGHKKPVKAEEKRQKEDSQKQEEPKKLGGASTPVTQKVTFPLQGQSTVQETETKIEQPTDLVNTQKPADQKSSEEVHLDIN